MPATQLEYAPAKVNLTLRVLRRRGDGYHDLESLVAFADVSDTLTFAPGGPLSLDVTGDNAAICGGADENLVLKAARLLAARKPVLKTGKFVLDKQLPVAAGLGGGSSDAAAALRLLARASGLAADDRDLFEAARETGADVPVCLDPQARVMTGVGHELSAPLNLPPLPVVLVNPRIALPTRDVFSTLRVQPGEEHGLSIVPRERAALIAWLRGQPNDLEPAAISLRPVVGDVLAALQSAPGAQLARMSGSGATCFALFADPQQAQSAADTLLRRQPGWWVRAATLR